MKTEQELVRAGEQVVRTLLKGKRIGWNEGLAWAADWIEGSLAEDDNERTIEFARNIAMSIRAAQKQSEDDETADAECSVLRERDDAESFVSGA